MLWEASAETVRNISLVRKVRLKDGCRVGFDAVEEVIVGWVKQFGAHGRINHGAKHTMAQPPPAVKGPPRHQEKNSLGYLIVSVIVGLW